MLIFESIKKENKKLRSLTKFQRMNTLIMRIYRKKIEKNTKTFGIECFIKTKIFSLYN